MKNRLAMMLCLLICLAGTVVAQRAPRKKPAPPPPTPPVQQVKQAVDQLTQAWAANKPDDLRRLCAEDVVVIESGRRFRGLQTVLDYLQFSFKNFPEMQIQLGSIEARVVGSMAWAYADSRMTQIASRGLKLNLAGYSSYVLERQRTGWKIVLMDFDVKPTEPVAEETPPASVPTIEGTWTLESSTNLSNGQGQRLTAMLLLTKTYYSLFTTVTDRRAPKDKNKPKPIADYSRKELQDLVRDLDAGAGVYRPEGNKLILAPALALLPNEVGQEVTLENVTVTRRQLSYEIVTPEGRFRRVWQRVE
jgi:ketosteroid isomerase-like protein